jgi:nucleotide-binding universal stress UspA family protein
MEQAKMKSVKVGPRNVYVGSVSPADRPVRILVGIDSPDASDSDHTDQIVRQAALMAARAGGELHIASAYSTNPRGASQSYRVERYLPALRVKARDRQRCAIRQLLRRLKIADAFVHVEEGEPQQVLDALASKLQPAVVVRASTRGNAVMIDTAHPTENVAA